MDVSVIVPTHAPDPSRLGRVLDALRAQTLPLHRWETLLVDNASPNPLLADNFLRTAPRNLRLVCEPEIGLTNARRRGFAEARAPFCVLVDDDNILAPDYLQNVVKLFSEHTRIGALGGKSLPEFEIAPPAWAQEFLPLLALRNPPDYPCIAAGLRPPGSSRNHYPADAAPIGAGMAIRRVAAEQWMERCVGAILPDRRGATLSSGGDNDIVFTLLQAGWQVGFFPELCLTHLIPPSRLTPPYLARLNRGIQKSWMQVLTKYDANPWSPIAPWTVPLRQAKAWFTLRGWSHPTGYIRWQGVCGQFEGRAHAPSTPAENCR